MIMYCILAHESVQAFVNTRQVGNRSHVVAVGEEDPGQMRLYCVKSPALFTAGQEINFCEHGTLAALDWMTLAMIKRTSIDE
ncbi:hypothetical protein PS862_02674 [Pseudomonas fluorescens]|uniref:Uncharacterized protein n=1 Tax=Pseudomonas fluorescens TaxID=294 RepID=A0A5E7K6N8_PSEFL|nr:hypothetical protein [Pseudomonas fluorescens]VVO97641.1 hypothetical protein PS862_02674 [Pseudomonas fluorescens]